MPRYDGTGPRGAGSMTGWGRGLCGSGARSGAGYGRGFQGGFGGGFGRGGGRGPSWGGALPRRGGGYGGAPYARPYPEDPARERDMLRYEADSLRAELDEINRRIQELEKGPAE